MALKDFSESELELWIEARFHAELKGIAMFQAEMASHKELLKANSKENQELLELYAGLKTFLKVMSMIERVAVFFTKVGLWLLMLWGIWTYLVKEAITSFKSGG